MQNKPRNPELGKTSQTLQRKAANQIVKAKIKQTDNKIMRIKETHLPC